MSSSKLVIKAANQKHDDFFIEKYELEWTVKHLKDHLCRNYPKNPDPLSIRLIYSGKLLHDHLTLKEVIRQNSEVKSHIIHLVHSTTNNSANKSPKVPTSTGQSCDRDEFDELTPGTSSLSNSSSSSPFFSSSSSSTASNSPISRPLVLDSSTSAEANTNTNPNLQLNRPDLTDAITRLNEIQSHLSAMFNERHVKDNERDHRRQMSDQQIYIQTLTEMSSWYESNGVSVQSNYWFSAYVQHLALYYILYTKYLSSVISSDQNIMSESTAFQTTNNIQISSQAISEPAQVQQNEQAAAQHPGPRRNQEFAQELQGDREDDWLGILHNTISFIILFTIIYYYSSFERFFVICLVVFFLFLYHNGWLTLQRRQINQNRPLYRNAGDAQNVRAHQGQNNAENNAGYEGVQGNETSDQSATNNARQPQPNIFRFVLTFLITFFTSMVPDRPRAAN